MIVDRINYKKVFPISSFCTEHIGLEASLDDKENPEEALNKLKVIVETLHTETLSNIDQYRGSSVREVESVVGDEVQAILDGIKNSPDMTELKSWWLRSKGNLGLSSAYKLKEKILTDAK